MHLFKKALSFVISHKIISGIAIVVLVILALLLRPKPPTPIATQKVEPTDITQTVSVSGTVGAKNIAALTFPVGGTISWIGVKVGDSVSVGQTIATLDSRTALKNLQQALLTYSIQRNTFDQTIANNGGTQNPDQSVNDTEKRILQDNQFNLTEAVNSVELSDLAKQQSILWTPIAGVVTRTDSTTPGTTAIAGTTTFTIVDPSSVVFNMDVDEADIGKIQAGQQVNLILDAYPNETLTLPVDSIDFVSHTTSNGGNAYTVSVKLGVNANYQYRIGMNGNADIITAKRQHVLTVPLASLVNTNQVYLKKGKTFVLKTVTLGLENDTQAQVISGLSAGDSIALDPTQVTKK